MNSKLGILTCDRNITCASSFLTWDGEDVMEKTNPEGHEKTLLSVLAWITFLIHEIQQESSNTSKQGWQPSHDNSTTIIVVILTLNATTTRKEWKFCAVLLVVSSTPTNVREAARFFHTIFHYCVDNERWKEEARMWSREYHVIRVYF